MLVFLDVCLLSVEDVLGGKLWKSLFRLSHVFIVA